jgi:structure-specific endonuclease subunit SLX1
VFRVWRAVDEKMESELRGEIDVRVDEHAVEHYDKGVARTDASTKSNDGNKLPLNGVELLDFGYTGMKVYVEKSRSIFAGMNNECSVCNKRIGPSEELVLVCEHDLCDAVSHMACLSNHFTNTSDTLLPVDGSCPSCKRPSKWQTLVKELSLRTRGEKELAKIFKKPRARKNGAEATAAVPEEETMTVEELEESEDDGFVDLEEFEAQVIKDALPDLPASPSGTKAKGRSTGKR